jgi:Patatin-like phospholipase
MSDLPQREFQIGLAISGAVSAGAYAAGVFDFLIEALDEWEKCRTDATVPNHRIGLKVMSGASAGAITAAIGAVSLAEERGQLNAQDPSSYHYLPKLYESWVEKPTLAAASGKSDFLSLTDLDVRPNVEDDFSRTSGIERPTEADPAVVTSVLNAQLLDEIAKAAIAVKQVRASPRLWVSETLHLYMTLTNLRGVPYQVPFDGGNYHMISHGDRVHYALKGLGAWSTKSKFADNDKKRELQAIWLAAGSDEQKRKWKDYAICALASSAFPVGLAPRLIGATLGANNSLNEYDGRLFPIDDIVGDERITPHFNKSVLAEQPFWFTCADGGIIDNDPFEYARFSLKENLDQPLVSTLEAVDRAVIMISAFPEEKPILRQGEPRTDIVGLFSALMPALINQARFKPDELALAADENHGSRYLIGPSRVVNGKDQRYAIASGLLGGFGGFVSRSFRDHDFQLGRRNCQWFLRTCFALPEANPIVKSWPAGVDRKRFQAPEGKDRRAHHCLIPLCGTAGKEVALPAWPRITVGEFEELQVRIAQRFDRVAPLIIRQNVGGFLGFLLGLVLKPLIRNIPGLIRDRALKFVRLALLGDLVRRDQIQGWNLSRIDTGLDADDVRLVLGELLNPRYDQRNAAGIVTAISVAATAGVDKIKVGAALEKLKQARGEPFQVWEAPWKDRKGGSLYTLMSRRPGFIRGVFGGRIGLGILKPTVDPPGR